MAEYVWKYFPTQIKREQSMEGGVAFLQLLDMELAALKEQKGSFWTSIVELFVEVKVFSVALEDNAALANARCIARFSNAVIKDKWGEEAAVEKMRALIADADRISTKVLLMSKMVKEASEPRH